MSTAKENGVPLDRIDPNTDNKGGENETNGDNNLLGVPRKGHRLSFMEQESLKERNRVNLLKQISAILKQGDQKYTKESLHRTFQDDDLLERIFCLFCEGDQLAQEEWIEFLKERLHEDKQLDFVEQVESAAYVLCGDGVVTKQDFCKIWKNKVVTSKLFRAVDASSGGVLPSDLLELIAAASDPRSRAGIDKESLERLERLFKETVGDQKEITREQFQKIVVSKNPFFTERVFQIFDADDSGSISLNEFLSCAARVASGSPAEKLRFLFQVYDLDGDGLIQHRELQHVMRAAMDENNMDFSDEQLRDLTSALFEDADLEGRGAITCDALRDQLNRHGGLLDNLSMTIDRWLIPPPRPEPLSFKQRLVKMKPYHLSMNYLRNNYVFVSYLGFYFLVNVCLFVARIVEYWDHNAFVIFARASGQCLNFSSSWVLVPMLRRSLTALRSVAGALLDRHVTLHKFAAFTLLAHAALHTVMHLCNFALVVSPASPFPLSVWLFSSRPRVFGLVPGWANPTGMLLVLVLAALGAASTPAVRRRGCFEVFYFTHLMYFPFWILLILHAPNFWKWFLVPGTVYIIEKMLRLWWLRSGGGRSYITSGALLSDRVLHVSARRPRGFSYRAGDYVFVNVPAVARYEWHPFTITSAPEESEYLWFHIRGVGEWTNRLYDHFEQQAKQEQIRQKTKRSNSTQSNNSDKSNKSRKSSKKPSIDSGYTNEAFTIDEESEQAVPRGRSLLSPLRFLEKSSSEPDVRRSNNNKRSEPVEYHRSESARFPSPRPPPRPSPRGVSAGALHLAESFRHLRTKPVIVACETPPDTKESLLTTVRRRLSKSLSPDKHDDQERGGEDPETGAGAETELEGISIGSQQYTYMKPLEMYIDGPYGAASSLMFSCERAVLVAAGIGVTPFASVLRSLAHRLSAAQHACAGCGRRCVAPGAAADGAPRSVDFVWINRSQRAFSWFVALLSALEAQQARLEAAGGRRFLRLHMFVTGALQRGDMRAVSLQVALRLLHARAHRDPLTGLRTRAAPGRPNWDVLLRRVGREAGPGEAPPHVFYCGPAPLGRELRDRCVRLGYAFQKEVF